MVVLRKNGALPAPRRDAATPAKAVPGAYLLRCFRSLRSSLGRVARRFGVR